jgi:hypothetical protein
MSTGKLKLYKGESDFKIKIHVSTKTQKIVFSKLKFIEKSTYIFAVGLEVICDIYFEWIETACLISRRFAHTCDHYLFKCIPVLAPTRNTPCKVNQLDHISSQPDPPYVETPHTFVQCETRKYNLVYCKSYSISMYEFQVDFNGFTSLIFHKS